MKQESTPKPCTKPEAVNISERIKKGSNAGNTRVHQSFMPWREASKELSGEDMIAIASSMAMEPDRKGADPVTIRRILILFISQFTSS